jgi:pilus assembly protein CpaF
MPLVKTLFEPIGKTAEKDRKTGISVESLAMKITGEIIEDKPYFVMDSFREKDNRDGLRREVIRILDRDNMYFSVNRDELIRGIFDFMFGYGALQKYIDDEDISDIDGTRYNEFTVKRLGERFRIDVDFGDERAFETYCRLIAVRSGGFLNDDDTHCRTADIKNKLRINVSIAPRNVSGPAISIRKHRHSAYTLENLKELCMLDDEAFTIVQKMTHSNQSILFCGKGAAGKTTLLRAFLNSLPELERVLVVESDAEIYPKKAFCIEQRTKRPEEGGRPVSLEGLVRDGLTMSLDTYCVGELVGEEAYSFVKASCTGHRMLGTIHSKNAYEAIGRIVSLAAGAGSGDSVERLMESAASGIDCVIYLKEFKVIEIISVTGVKNGEPVYESIYRKDTE